MCEWSRRSARSCCRSYRLSRKTGAVFAYNAHELETEVLGFSGLKQKIFKFIERRHIKHVDVISVVNDRSPTDTNNIPAFTAGRADEHPDRRRQHDRPARNARYSRWRTAYVHVGYISPGCAADLDAFAAKPHVHVVFLGDGDLRHLVERGCEASEHTGTMVEPTRSSPMCTLPDRVGGEPVRRALDPEQTARVVGCGDPPLSSGLGGKRLLGLS